MLKWFRARASCIAMAVLTSLATLGISLAGVHPDDCHDDCIVAVIHDASAHEIGADTRNTDSPPLHCLVCHWARSFRPRSEVVFVAAPISATGIWTNVEIYTAAPVAPSAQPPLRSPPASPVLS
jgi:hypothetical protein